MDSIPFTEDIRDTILEWTQEGYQYLYQEQPQRMRELEAYLQGVETDIDIIYRGTDWKPILDAQAGDVISVDRVSSWSYNSNIPKWMYEDIDHRILVLMRASVRGRDVHDISFFFDEEEILLAPHRLHVIDKKDHVLYVRLNFQ